MGRMKRKQEKSARFFSQFFHVFSFTIVQAVKGKKYVKITIGVLLLLLGITIGGSVFLVYSQHREKIEKDTSIEKVWLTKGILEKDFLLSNENTAYQRLQVEIVPDIEAIPVEELGDWDILIDIQEEKDSYAIHGILTESSQISKEEAKEFIDAVKECFYYKLVRESGISQEKLELLKKECTGEVYTAGDSEHGMEWIITVSVPIFVGIFIYILMVMYGQIIMLEVSSEKTSKLMETMLVNVYPGALVSGKILGTALLGILQVVIWTGGVVCGLVLGILLGSMLYPEERESYRTIIETASNYGIGRDFSSAFQMAIFVIGLGILLYCFLAGISGSFIEKPENAGNVQQLVQIPLMVCFMVSYFAIFTEKKEFLGILRYFPFTAPFILPGEMLVGTSSVNTGWLVVGILLFMVFLLGMISGKVYKYQALNQGK